MSCKRKSDELSADSRKKFKSNVKDTVSEKLKTDFKSFADFFTLSSKNDDFSESLLESIDLFKSSFPNEFKNDLPPIIHLHQIYSVLSPRTQVDREIESLRSRKRVFLFKFDSSASSSNGETLICLADDFREYVNRRKGVLSLAGRLLIDKFLDRILAQESHQFSIEKTKLILNHRLNESQISTLVQNGLLAIKDTNRFWFAVPGIGEFRRQLVDARKSVIDILKRQKYKELNVMHFFDSLNVTRNKNFRNVNKLGTAYVLCDLIGNEVVTRVDSPIGLTIRLNH